MKKIILLFLLIFIFSAYSQPGQGRYQGRSGYQQSIIWNDLHKSLQDTIRAIIGDSAAANLSDSLASLTASNGIVKVGRNFRPENIKDTTAISSVIPDSAGVQYYLKQLSSTNINGGGVLVSEDSTTGDTTGFGVWRFKTGVAGKHLVRDLYKQGFVKAIWAGITVNGSGDNTTKLNNLITEVGKGTIDIPLGTIRITGPILLKRSIVLRGPNIPDNNSTSTGAIFLLAANSDTTMLETPFAASGYISGTTHYMGLENLWFNGNADSQNTFMTSGKGVVDFSGAQVSSYMRNIIITDCYGTAFKTRNSDALFENLWVAGSYLNADSAAYEAIIGDTSNAGVNGLFVFNNFYVEHGTNDLTKSATTDTTAREHGLLISQTTKVEINGLHTESHLRGVEIEGSNFNIVITGFSDNATDTSLYLNSQPRSLRIVGMHKGEYFTGMGVKVLLAGPSKPTIRDVPALPDFTWNSSATTQAFPFTLMTTSATNIRSTAITSGTAFYGRSETGVVYRALRYTSTGTPKLFLGEDSSGTDLFEITSLGATRGYADIAGRAMSNIRVQGDAQDRFQILGDGTIGWGSGASSLDVNLKRIAANVLNTDDTFLADTLRISNTVINNPAAGDTYWKQGASAAPDTLLIYINSKWQKFVGSVNNP